MCRGFWVQGIWGLRVAGREFGLWGFGDGDQGCVLKEGSCLGFRLFRKVGRYVGWEVLEEESLVL